MERINIKIFASGDTGLAAAIPVFHRWIQDRACPELAIDVADYSHVPAGPGVVLVTHEANYSLDHSRNRLGLLYNRKAALSGTPVEKLKHCWNAALWACQRLEQEPEFSGKLKFNPSESEVILNDRLRFPNTEDTWRTVRADIEQFFDELYGRGGYTLTRSSDPRGRIRCILRSCKSSEELSWPVLGARASSA